MQQIESRLRAYRQEDTLRLDADFGKFHKRRNDVGVMNLIMRLRARMIFARKTAATDIINTYDFISFAIKTNNSAGPIKLLKPVARILCGLF